MRTTEDVICDDISAINRHDVEQILRLSTDDHEFVDAYGAVVPWSDLQSAWTGYFAFMPRYVVEAETILCRDDFGAVFGFASGGFPASGGVERSWPRPWAWRALGVGARVRLWQV